MSEPVKRLTEEQLARVDSHRSELFFKKGELLSKQGMFMSHIFYLRKGFAKLYLENDDGLTIIGIARPGTFIGIQSLYGEPVFPFSAVALTDTEVCLKDITVFRNLVLENSEFAKGVIELLNADLVQSYNRMFSLTTKQLDGRFSELLMFLSRILYESNPFDLTISRKDIADLLSATPESVSRLISNFKSRGVIGVSGHTIELLDMEQLETMCHCDSLNISRI